LLASQTINDYYRKTFTAIYDLTISRAMSKTIKVDDKVLADIKRGFSVPARPELLIKLQNLMTQPDPELNTIADVIALDVATSATILKTVNSPLYGLARTISDIKGSVRYLGMQGVYNLVTSCLLKQEFSQQKNSAIALDQFWQNSTNIANAAVFINKQLKQPIANEKLFSLGLFHDCGIPVMALKYSNYQTCLMQAFNSPDQTLPKIEEALYGINHATLGYFVASSWRLPKDICQLILRHHERNFLDKLTGSKVQLAFAILKLAENISYRHLYFTDCADWSFIGNSVLTLLELDEYLYQDLLEDLSELLT
jgi:HD-like signal output (HDOD) protein